MSNVAVPIVAFVVTGAVIILAPLVRAYAKQLERSSPAEVPTHVNQRLERMEQAIDAIAEQVERVAEGQRFTTKLLSERGAPHAPELPGGS